MSDHDRYSLVVVSPWGINRFYLGTVVAGSICIGFGYGWLVGLGIGLIGFSILGGMDEVGHKIHVLDSVQRKNMNDHYTQLTLLNNRVTQITEDEET